LQETHHVSNLCAPFWETAFRFCEGSAAGAAIKRNLWQFEFE